MFVFLRGSGDGPAVEEIKALQGLKCVDSLLEVIIGKGSRLELKIFGGDKKVMLIDVIFVKEETMS
jgi:hypothetical protein